MDLFTRTERDMLAVIALYIGTVLVGLGVAAIFVPHIFIS
jgi:hypothetical protein